LSAVIAGILATCLAGGLVSCSPRETASSGYVITDTLRLGDLSLCTGGGEGWIQTLRDYVPIAYRKVAKPEDRPIAAFDSSLVISVGEQRCQIRWLEFKSNPTQFELDADATPEPVLLAVFVESSGRYRPLLEVPRSWSMRDRWPRADTTSAGSILVVPRNRNDTLADFTLVAARDGALRILADSESRVQVVRHLSWLVVQPSTTSWFGMHGCATEGCEKELQTFWKENPEFAQRVVLHTALPGTGSKRDSLVYSRAVGPFWDCRDANDTYLAVFEDDSIGPFSRRFHPECVRPDGKEVSPQADPSQDPGPYGPRVQRGDRISLSQMQRPIKLDERLQIGTKYTRTATLWDTTTVRDTASNSFARFYFHRHCETVFGDPSCFPGRFVAGFGHLEKNDERAALVLDYTARRGRYSKGPAAPQLVGIGGNWLMLADTASDGASRKRAYLLDVHGMSIRPIEFAFLTAGALVPAPGANISDLNEVTVTQDSPIEIRVVNPFEASRGDLQCSFTRIRHVRVSGADPNIPVFEVVSDSMSIIEPPGKYARCLAISPR
jgi:hypothetical protein